MTVPMMHNGLSSHALLAKSWLQMQAPAGLGDDGDDAVPKSNASEVFVPARIWKSSSTHTPISQQQFPPTIIYGISIRQLLSSWADLFMDPLHEKSRAVESLNISSDHGTMALKDRLMKVFGQRTDRNTEMPPPSSTSRYLHKDNVMVLHHMQEVIGELTEIPTNLNTLENVNFTTLSLPGRKLEIVGLIPRMLAVRRIRSREVDASVLALCVFSQKKLQDDDRGSLRKHIGLRFGKQWTRVWWGRAKKQFDVFAIEGIADAPGLSELSTRVLLLKIAEYAHKENKILTVSKGACISSGGKDLTQYYVRLGFEKVEMEGQLHELIYAGTPSSAKDVLADGEQMMVAMSLQNH